MTNTTVLIAIAECGCVHGVMSTDPRDKKTIDPMIAWYIAGGYTISEAQQGDSTLLASSCIHSEVKRLREILSLLEDHHRADLAKESSGLLERIQSRHDGAVQEIRSLTEEVKTLNAELDDRDGYDKEQADDEDGERQF